MHKNIGKIVWFTQWASWKTANFFLFEIMIYNIGYEGKCFLRSRLHLVLPF